MVIGVLIFRSTHEVLMGEKLLKQEGIAMRLIPVPRSLTSDCGLAIRIDHIDFDRSIRALNLGENIPKEYHVKDGEVYVKKEIDGI